MRINPPTKGTTMSINYKLVAAILALALAAEEYTVIKANRTNKRLFKNLKTNLSTVAQMNRYLTAKLDEAGVETSEFDKIVINILNDQLS